MKVIQGQILCMDATADLPKGSVIFINAHDENEATKILGHQTLQNRMSFPVDYKVELENEVTSGFQIHVSIEFGECTLFHNQTAVNAAVSEEVDLNIHVKAL